MVIINIAIISMTIIITIIIFIDHHWSKLHTKIIEILIRNMKTTIISTIRQKAFANVC